jgi:hypothetical protein
MSSRVLFIVLAKDDEADFDDRWQVVGEPFPTLEAAEAAGEKHHRQYAESVRIIKVGGSATFASVRSWT